MIFMKLLVAQLARQPGRRCGCDRLELVGEQHAALPRSGQRAVGTPHAVPGAHHHRVIHLALLDLAAWNGVLTLTLMTSPRWRNGGVPPSTLMHIRVRAPLLSAAFSIVRIWIMIRTCFGPLERFSAARPSPHLEQPPRLAPRHGAARGDGHHVALLGGAVLVVRQQLGGTADVLA